MASTYLTPTQVTREALRILHAELNFIGNINRQYDKSYAQEGAKIGDSLKIRLPNKYVVTDGAVMTAQDVTESSTTLQVNNQKHVGMRFSSADLTLSIDDFSKRYIKPAMTTLAASIEADAISMYKDVYQIVDQDGSAFTFDTSLAGKEVLDLALAPNDGDRTCLLMPRDQRKLVNDTKGLFQDSASVAKQYKTGAMGHSAGFDYYQNTILPLHTTGTAAKTTGYTVNGATEQGSTITIQTGTTSFLKGDIVTFAGCYRVHPETKQVTSDLQQFVVTANSGTSATSLAISPAIVVSGANQNVSAYPDNSGAVVKVGAGASEKLRTSLAFHKDAFAFATADLVMPKGVDFAAREVFDGISMRIVRAYDINNDNMPCRVDVLYGYKTLRAELAARMHADG
ncbi:MAG: hypothetical protein J0H39_13940 [Alphaproteobacteria bacterium]|nr:hypothetical protein [Alphaproteobacteria bacterium]